MRVFEINEQRCVGCLKCLGSCPTHAVQIRTGGVNVNHDLCIACGACFRNCGHEAITQISELETVKGFVRSKRKVILSIDPACIAFLPDDLSMEQLAAAAQELGIWDVADASEAASAIAAEYARLIHEKKMDNIIFSTCPVVQNLMEQFYPELLHDLAPVASPMIAHGRMLKRDFTSAAVVYVSTCTARLEEAKDVRHSTEINAVLSIGELLEWMNQEGIDPKSYEEEPLLSDGSGIGELAAISGGMMECTDYFAPDHQMKQICVDGINDCISLLDEIAQGKIHGCLIEMNACHGGCVGGNAGMADTLEKRGRFSATLQIRNFVDSRDKQPFFDTHGIALANPTIDFSVAPYTPTGEQIDEMLFYIGIGNSRLQKDCGHCGYSTCRARAEAILKGQEPAAICLPIREEMRRDIFSMIYENLPVAVMLIDETQKIVQFNHEAASLFAIKQEQETYIFELMDPGDVQYVLDTGLGIRNRRYDIPDLFLRVEASLVPIRENEMVLAIFTDMTAEEAEEDKQLQSKLKSVEMAQKLIDKQMTVAQEIAFLLGETTAETKVTLNQLKSRILGEEDDQ